MTCSFDYTGQSSRSSRSKHCKAKNENRRRAHSEVRTNLGALPAPSREMTLGDVIAIVEDNFKRAVSFDVSRIPEREYPFGVI